MFKRLLGRFLPNNSLNKAMTEEANTNIPEGDESSAPIEQEKPQSPGVQVPAGPQVPGTDMSTGDPVGVDADATIKAPEKPTEEAEAEANPDEDPMIPV